MNIYTIAAHFENQYFSILCRVDRSMGLLESLKARYKTEPEVLRLIASGHIELCMGIGCLLTCGQALAHESPLALVTYAITNEVEKLFVFERGGWDSIPLIVEELEAVAVYE